MSKLYKTVDVDELYRLLQRAYIKDFGNADGYVHCDECVVEDCASRKRNKKLAFCLYYTYDHEGKRWS